MSVKSKRLSIKDLKQEIGSKDLQFILKNGTSRRVRLLKFERDIIIVKTALGHRLTINLRDIREVWKDQRVG